MQSARRSSQSFEIRGLPAACWPLWERTSCKRIVSQGLTRKGKKKKDKKKLLVERVLAACKSSRLSGWQEDFLSRLVSESNHPFDISGCVVSRLEYATFANSVAHTHTHPGNSGDSRLFYSQDVAEKQGMFLIRFRAKTKKRRNSPFTPSTLSFLIPLHHFKRNMRKSSLRLIRRLKSCWEETLVKSLRLEQLHQLLVNNSQLSRGCFKTPAFCSSSLNDFFRLRAKNLVKNSFLLFRVAV